MYNLFKLLVFDNPVYSIINAQNNNYYTNLPLTATLHFMMRNFMMCRCPSLTATPSGVSPSLVTSPIVVRMLGISLESRRKQKHGERLKLQHLL